MKINIYIVCLLISILVNTVCSATDPNYISPETVEGAVTIDTSTAKKLFDEGAFFIDVRKTSDFEAGRIPGALHLEYSDKDPSKRNLSPESLKKHHIKTDSSLIFYCNGIHCARSSLAAIDAIKWGYTKIYYYRLGFPDWKMNGHPFE